ncbi:hypothetical protein [Streptomyces cyaneofuscatus]|uniref:hypothetical protein n=1 Tax=Streptomyces cyaneofuscatus TaxID=66883 RepID=UPI0033A9130C
MRFRTVAASAALVLFAMTGAAACSSSSGAAETPQPPAGPAASVKSAPVEGLEGMAGRIETGKRAGVPTLDGQSVVGPSECAVPVEEIPVECAVEPSFGEISVGESAGDVPDAQ